MSSPSPDAALSLGGLSAQEGTLARRTYLTLRAAIVELRVAPGAALRKEAICKELGVSRSPVSEAMAKLAAEGLVQIVPQAGSFVAPLSLPEIREGAFLREAIELAAIEHLAPRITDDQIQALRRTLAMQAALVEEGDRDGFYALDAQMHGMLLDFTGYRRLAIVADSAFVHVDRARRLILPQGRRVADTLEEHRAVLAALEARDPDAARTALRHHLRQLMHHLTRLAADRAGLFQPEET
ncbi:GntR family transcriptional regulator [Jannaschia formosa]|uniref:GntR family transcriptional regulator n=1 Tax=Jannaschia formosa TaxID=2259592 RepID=UPI000E1BA51B|nr:GntR family transcriptional regulator [Jannaschia formosa]TFL16498.1 GntR family transcriptional regulator [Jannaschia formosa]